MTAAEPRAAAAPPACACAGQTGEFRLSIFTGPDRQVAVVWYQAAGLAAAIEQARRFLTAHQGPGDRYGELHAWGDFLTTIRPGV